MTLSAPYRTAQRLLASWLEGDRIRARSQVFALRTALAALNATERHSLSRWVAWLCVAAASRGESILGRIRQLDDMLGRMTFQALSQLPAGGPFLLASQHWKSA
ncbi:MAG TPA: hypothetical protein VME63_07430 [Dyella sp.]|uniref:hypothetical protein n=1 Tax=Dyella sp. TaxID=1869338 RepID=UPI002BA3ECC2|nr:hypothetical protein [Dyella sp.]HTV85220.1 hypothetical protein [Dyella sp.]